jgi:heterodisulfide reductase subunit C
MILHQSDDSGFRQAQEPSAGENCESVYPIDPDWNQGEAVAASCKADIDLCWTCGSCDNGCPIGIATGRLRPQRILRMAVFGMLDELFALPDVWYCISCRQCLHGCPNRVKPYELIAFLQNEAVAKGILSRDFINAYQKLFSQFQRVRWRTVVHCFQKELNHLTTETWYHWLKTPLRRPVYHPIKVERWKSAAPAPHFQGSVCLTCSECSGCCPIISDGDVFDPQRIIRKVTLGLIDDVLRSPQIWLCLGCKRCSEVCSQTVSGYDIIQQLQRQAIAERVVDPYLPIRLLEANRIIFPNFLDEVDTLIGLYKQQP